MTFAGVSTNNGRLQDDCTDTYAHDRESAGQEGRIDEAELAAAAFLARYQGRTLDAYGHDLWAFQWAADEGLVILSATRPQIEFYVRAMEGRGELRTRRKLPAKARSGFAPQSIVGPGSCACWPGALGGTGLSLRVALHEL